MTMDNVQVYSSTCLSAVKTCSLVQGKASEDDSANSHDGANYSVPTHTDDRARNRLDDWFEVSMSSALSFVSERLAYLGL